MPEKAISADRKDKHHSKLCVDFSKTMIETIISMEKIEKYLDLTYFTGCAPIF